jgi:methylthioribose-1-phosphate isomerase
MTTAVQSPLFEPVLWQDRGFKILDELQLPERIEYLEVDDVSQAIGAVRDMRTRAFGQVLTFLYSGALLAQAHRHTDATRLSQLLAEMTQQFCTARPTFDFRGLGSCFEGWLAELPSNIDPGGFVADCARDLGRRLVRGRLARAKLAAAILPNPARVLTHCNVSGELVAMAQFCQRAGKEISLIATETRPYLQGTRLTAWELAQANVAVTVIPDCAVAQIMERGEVNTVLVGSDRSAQNGDIINKVGTYPLALMAKEYAVPFHALVQDPRSLAFGEGVEIEERPAAELLTFHGQALVPSAGANLSARYPAFDVTPAALITHLIGFDSIHTPETFCRKYQTGQPRRARPVERRAKYLLSYGVPSKDQYALLGGALESAGAESVLIPEMRPQLRGARIVAPALAARNLPVTLISDNMMGTLFAQGEISRLCLYCERLTDQGAIAACGSLLAARLARWHRVPVEVLQGSAGVAPSADQDVGTFLGRNVCPPGVAIRAVGAEMVPWLLLQN